MAILDKIVGIFSSDKTSGMDYSAVLLWLETQGGISGIMEKMKQHGLGQMVESWLGKGDNLALHPEQILSFIDTPALNSLAKTCGLDLQGAAGLLANCLPLLVDGLSDAGELTANASDNLVSAGLSVLQK